MRTNFHLMAAMVLAGLALGCDKGPAAKSTPASENPAAPTNTAAPAKMVATAAQPTPQKVDKHQLELAVEKTEAKLRSTMASWTMVYDFGGGANVHVEALHAPDMQRFTFVLNRGATKLKWLEIIVRGRVWYVTEGDKRGKYRPYEAPTESPNSYLFLDAAKLIFVDPHVLETTATLESIRDGVASYKSPLTGSIKQQIESSIRKLDEILQSADQGHASAATLAGLRQARRNLNGVLSAGSSFKIDLETGLIVESGAPGNKRSIRDFRWHDEIDPALFAVDDRLWPDQTAPPAGDDRSNLAMIKHNAAWRPGQKESDSEAELIDVQTGKFRRVGYSGAICLPICFSRDRKRVYVGGAELDRGTIGLFEIDLESGTQRKLGEPLLSRGMVMFGGMSPDGKTLAVTQAGTAKDALEEQIVLVDVASGRARELGKPLDSANLSWLPEGDGLVLVSRAAKDFDKPSEGTVCRMNLQGEVTRLRKGNMPFSLAPKARILYLDDDGESSWMTCDLEGKNPERVLNGLPHFNFPAVSPNGGKLLIMKFGGENGPQPNVVDLDMKQTTPIPVEKGFWRMPVWR